MCFQKMLSLFIAASACVFPIHSYAGDSQQSSNSTNNTHEFVSKIYQAAHGQPMTHILMTGSSAAGYDRALLTKDLNDYLKFKVNRNKNKYGNNTVTVLTGGATTDGIGLMYAPSITNTDVFKVGIVSNQAQKYPDNIGQDQLATLFVESYKDDQGKPTWEVKTTKEGPSLNSTIHDLLPTRQSDHALFEGGAIALAEAIEWLTTRAQVSFDSTNPEKNKAFDLDLVIGYQPTVAKKDQGYRAAEMMASFLLRFPEIIPLNVHVNIFRAGEINKGPMSFQEFEASTMAKEILEKTSQKSKAQRQKDIESYRQNIANLLNAKKKSTFYSDPNYNAKIQAGLNFLEAWNSLDQKIAGFISDQLVRDQQSLAHWKKVMDPKTMLRRDDADDRRSGLARESYERLSQIISFKQDVLNKLTQSSGQPSMVRCEVLL